MSARTWIVIAGITGALGVVLGAFGAHVLPVGLQRLGVAALDIPQRIETYEIGVRYHMYHALALLGVGLLARHMPGRGLALAGWAFLLGVTIFSGLLYAIALTGMRILGLVVPVGGVLLIAGWLALAYAGWTKD